MTDRNQTIPFLLLALGSGATGALVAALTVGGGSDSGSRPDPVVVEARLASFREELGAELREELRAEWSAIQPRQQGARVAVPEVDREQVAAIVAELLQDGSKQPEVAESGAEQGSEEAGDALPDPEDFVAQIAALKSGDPRARELWERAKEAGQLEAILELYDAKVEAAPNDPAVQVEAARGFLAAAQQQPNHPEGLWWRRSDELYGTTLELDPNHWDARMEKAVNLTFWPDMYGRKKEAIGHFETLISQAEQLPAEDRHARAYVLLGNLLQQDGDDEAAREVWSRGRARHPASSSLATKLGR